MNWFVVALVMTVGWGNGAVEEGRTMWTSVFYGTAVDCQQRAEEIRARNASRPLGESSREPSVAHGQMPRIYNGGIRSLEYVAGACAPFTSPAAIKAAFPKDWEFYSGSKLENGVAVTFEWWDGADGAVLSRP